MRITHKVFLIGFIFICLIALLASCNGGKTDTTQSTSCDHTFGDWKVIKEADCENDGEKERACTFCGAKETEKISSGGHSFSEWTATKEADCENDGEKERSCAFCGTKETEKISSEGHSFGEWTVTKEADCENEGEEERICSKCGDSETKSTGLGEHNPVTDPAKEASCTQKGLTEGSHCSICGKIFIEQTETEKKEHSYTETVIKPTCTNVGYTNHTCSECKVSYKDSYTSKLGHNFINGVCTLCKAFEAEVYVDGVKSDDIPSKGNYVVYVRAASGEKSIAWNYASWKLADASEKVSIYFYSVEKIYSSLNSLIDDASNLKVGDIVGTSSYHKGVGRGAAIYKIVSTSSAQGSVYIGSGKYAEIVPFTVGSEKVITVDMFGAYADGVSGDDSAINSAVNFSGATTVEFEGKNYIQKTRICVWGIKNKTINGRGASISNSYSGDSVIWTDFEIANSSSNITLKNLALNCTETKARGTLFMNNDHVQLYVTNSSYITIENVTVYTPNNTTNDRHITSIWVQSGVSNIEIKDCTIKNFSKSSVGGGIWVSNVSDIKILNNHIEKCSHDEVLAFFNGSVSNVLVEGNYIYTHDEPSENTSAHAIGFGVWNDASLIKNVIFRNNEVDVVAVKDAMIFSNTQDIEIYNNKITLRNNSPSEPIEYGVFRVAEPDIRTQSNVKIYNNDITVICDYNKGDRQITSLVYDLGSGFEVYDNIFTVNAKIYMIIEGTQKNVDFKNNTININAAILGSNNANSTNKVNYK